MNKTMHIENPVTYVISFIFRVPMVIYINSKNYDLIMDTTSGTEPLY